MSRSQEFNLVNILEAGSGRKGTTYSFDYSYCVLNELPTHLLMDSEKIDKERSYKEGQWTTRNVTIDDEAIKQAEIPGKIFGTIDFIKDRKGIIKCLDNNSYFFSEEYIVSTDRGKSLYLGKEVVFYPWILADAEIATEIEVI